MIRYLIVSREAQLDRVLNPTSMFSQPYLDVFSTHVYSSGDTPFGGDPGMSLTSTNDRCKLKVQLVVAA